MEDPTEEDLSLLKEYINQICDVQLHTHIFCSRREANKNRLVMWNKEYATDFRLTPTFHLVGSAITRETFEVMLVAYQGSILETKQLDLSRQKEDQEFTTFIQNFCQNRFKLCCGVQTNPTNLFLLRYSNLLPELLIERIESDFVIRSRVCILAVLQDSETTIAPVCSECSNLKSRLKPPINLKDSLFENDSLNGDHFLVAEDFYPTLDMDIIKQESEHELDHDSELDFAAPSIVNPSHVSKSSKVKSEPFSLQQCRDETQHCSIVPSVVPYETLEIGLIQLDAAEQRDIKLTVLKDIKDKKCVKCDAAYNGSLKRHLRTKACIESAKLKENELLPSKTTQSYRLRGGKPSISQETISLCEESFKLKCQAQKSDQMTESDEESQSDMKVCFKCGLQFNDLPSFKQHLKTSQLCQKHHLEEVALKKKLKKGPKFKLKHCEKCQKSFHGISNYMKHLRSSSDCKDAFKSKKKKKSPTTNTTYYLNKGGFLCPICGKNYSCPSALDIHMGCMHGVDSDGKTPVEQHVCDICGNSYGHKLRLKEHIFIYHKKGKLKCNQCDKIFHVQNKLVTHQVAYHLKIRPFKCPECDYEASEMSNVYKHCQKHHGYRAKSKDVRIDFEKLEIIRQKLNYNYFGKTAETAKNKQKP